MSIPQSGESVALALEARLLAAQQECAALRAQLEEARSVLRAIRNGEVDAVVAAGANGPQVFTLEGADHPYRVMVESMSEGAATLIADGTVAYANARLATLLQVPLERMPGKPLEQFLAPPDRERFAAACKVACLESRVEDVEFQTADGTAVPTRVALTPLSLPSHSGEVVPAVCLVATDLTDARRHAELAVAIKERVRAEAALRLAARQKDIFLAMLSHELRNPLAPIRNAGTLLTRLVGADPKAQALIAMIQRQTDQLTRIVDDLLDMSRIAQDRITLKKEPLEIGTIIGQAIETVQPFISEKGHQLRVDRPTTPLYVEGDRARLAQSLSNLLHNAAKYTDSGGTITLMIHAAEDHIDFEVHDDGSGISPELLPHVFDLFVQSERTLDRAEGGLGIGLSLVKGLVEMHGGSVKAVSEGPQCGSTFTIRLPRIAAPQSSKPQAATIAVPARRILIVDDNVDAADSLALLLKSNGHEVETVYGAAAALEAAARANPEFVLLDIGLPDIDGYQLARQLRTMRHMDKACLIAVTGYGQAEDHQQSRAAGFDGHLVKPVDLLALDRVLSG